METPRFFFVVHTPMQLVAPRAVRIAVAADAMICAMNLMVSFFVIVLNFNYQLSTVRRWGFCPKRLISRVRRVAASWTVVLITSRIIGLH